MSEDADILTQETTEETDSEREEHPEATTVRPRSERTPKIITRDAYCTRMRGTECARCQLACPAGAIDFDAQRRPVIDGRACTHCGICMGICDTFTTKHMSMDDVHDHIVNVALRGQNVVITCEEYVAATFTPANNVVVLPCLACLSPEFWTAILAENINVSISVNMRNCPKCKKAGSIAGMLYGRAVETAESYVRERKVGYIRKLPKKDLTLEREPDPEVSEKRAAFQDALGDVMSIASGRGRIRTSKTLNDYVNRREREKAAERLRLSSGDEAGGADARDHGRTMFPKRQLLLSAIDVTPDIAERIPIMLARTDATKCASHGDCVDVCPTGARRAAGPDETPIFAPRYCIACGLCTAVCTEGAITLEETTAAALLRKRKRAAAVSSEADAEAADAAATSQEGKTRSLFRRKPAKKKDAAEK